VLKVETTGTAGSYKIRITSPVLARSVYLSASNLDVKLSDNYFDLLPGETVEIVATSTVSLDILRSQLKVISLTDAFGASVQPATVGAAR
jgi:beta-mannosidase